MLISKWITTGAIATGLALSSLVATAATTGTQQIPRAGAACDQAKQFRFFLQQMAISDGNTSGWPYADATEPTECRASKAAARVDTDAARASLQASPAAGARVATTNS